MIPNIFGEEQKITLRDIIKEKLEDYVYELCQYQKCDNCSIGSLTSCVLRRCHDFPLDEPLNEEELRYLGK